VKAQRVRARNCIAIDIGILFIRPRYQSGPASRLLRDRRYAPLSLGVDFLASILIPTRAWPFFRSLIRLENPNVSADRDHLRTVARFDYQGM
jgi:hypothetical protein